MQYNNGFIAFSPTGKMKSRSISLLFLVCLLGFFVVWASYVFNCSTFIPFLSFYLLVFISRPPRKAISPLTIVYLYYGAWFVAAPIFAPRYFGMLDKPEYSLSLAMAYTVFGLSILSIELASRFIARLKMYTTRIVSKKFGLLQITFLYIVASFFIMLIINASGGFSRWLADPGEAFLNRSGSGVYVILSHFFTILLAAASGHYAFTRRKKMALFLFLLWLAITSPVHGSKLQIGIFLVVLFIPWLRNLKFFDFRSVILFIALALVFLLGLYFRGFSFNNLQILFANVFNYFNTLELLAISVRDFEPSLLTTFFLPFNKFLTPIGLSSPNLYYDMNHLLTDIYYPQAWLIRATEQWPVETDMYLNFYFFGGLWLIVVYFFSIAALCKIYERQDNLGGWVVGMLLSIYIVSHLRGSLYNHTDFYLYPMMFVIYQILKRYHFKEKILNRSIHVTSEGLC